MHPRGNSWRDWRDMLEAGISMWRRTLRATGSTIVARVDSMRVAVIVMPRFVMTGIMIVSVRVIVFVRLSTLVVVSIVIFMMSSATAVRQRVRQPFRQLEARQSIAFIPIQHDDAAEKASVDGHRDVAVVVVEWPRADHLVRDIEGIRPGLAGTYFVGASTVRRCVPNGHEPSESMPYRSPCTWKLCGITSAFFTWMRSRSPGLA